MSTDPLAEGGCCEGYPVEVGGAQHREECPVHQPVDANGKAALRNLYEAFDRVKAEEWRIFVAATGYDPEDPSEDDYGTCVREAVAQVRADERQKVGEWRDAALKFSDDYHEELDKRIDAEAEVARIHALLADEGTVEKAARAITAPVWPLSDPGLTDDIARAALGAVAGLIGGEDE